MFNIFFITQREHSYLRNYFLYETQQKPKETPEEKFQKIQRSYLVYTLELKQDIIKITNLEDIEILKIGLEGQLDVLLGQVEEITEESKNNYKNLKKDVRSEKVLVRKAESLYRSYRKLYAELSEEVEEIQIKTKKVHEILMANQYN